MAKTRNKFENYACMPVERLVSASTSALSSSTINGFYTSTPKAKSVSFLLSEPLKLDQNSSDEHSINPTRSDRTTLTENVKVSSTIPQYFMKPSYTYEDEFHNTITGRKCEHYSVHSAVNNSVVETNSHNRMKNRTLCADSCFTHDQKQTSSPIANEQIYRRHSVSGKVPTEKMYSQYNIESKFNVDSPSVSPRANFAEEYNVDGHYQHRRPARIFSNAGYVLNTARKEDGNFNKCLTTITDPYFRDSVHGHELVEELQRHQIELMPCEMSSNYKHNLDLAHNVYYIKSSACDQNLAWECTCTCPCSSPIIHSRHLAVRTHLLPECDPASSAEGYVYSFCDQERDLNHVSQEENTRITTSNDNFYRTTSLLREGRHYDRRRSITWNICIKILWPCMFLNQLEPKISESPPLPPPPPPPTTLSQETLSTRFPASTSLKSKSNDGIDEGKTATIRYSIVSYSSSSSTMGSKCSKMPKKVVFLFILCIAAVFGLTTKNMIGVDDYEERIHSIHKLLNTTILVDGHNDLAWNIRMYKHNLLNKYNYDQNLKQVHPWSTSNWSQTDLPRLRSGRVGAQMWSAYTHCESQFKDAIQMALEQIDLIKRFTKMYDSLFNLCLSYDDIVETGRRKKICSIITLEGGHNIANSLAVLRMYYDLGVRSMALTNKDCSTPWAESAEMEKKLSNRTFPVIGLNKFGITVINELNRLGMVIDLSGTSSNTMRDALNASKAPVVFSHSNARSLCNVTQNVPDDIIRLLVQNRGVIMVTFYPTYLNCKNEATIANVVEHINYLRHVAGIDHIGIGSGFDGIDRVPYNLNDTSFFPQLFIELTAPGNPEWQPDELKKLAGLNILRVMHDVEKVRDSMKNVLPHEDVFKRFSNNKTGGRRYDREMRVCISHNHILN